MAIPPFEDLMLPILQFAVREDVITRRKAIESLADELKLSEEEKAARLSSGQGVLYHRIGWALMGLLHAGLLERPSRGQYAVTDKGRELIANPPDKMSTAYLRKNYPEYRKWLETFARGRDGIEQPQPDSKSTTPEESIDSSFKEWKKGFKDSLLDAIRSMPPQGFEELVLDLMEAMKYGSRNRLSHVNAPDGGIDGIINEDRLGLSKIYLQAKRYAHDHSVGSQLVRNFVGAMDGKGATKGVFVTTSNFSADASSFIDGIRGTKSVVLIDGEKLSDLLIDHEISVKSLTTYKLMKIDANYFDCDE